MYDFGSEYVASNFFLVSLYEGKSTQTNLQCGIMILDRLYLVPTPRNGKKMVSQWCLCQKPT